MLNTCKDSSLLFKSHVIVHNAFEFSCPSFCQRISKQTRKAFKVSFNHLDSLQLLGKKTACQNQLVVNTFLLVKGFKRFLVVFAVMDLMINVLQSFLCFLSQCKILFPGLGFIGL